MGFAIMHVSDSPCCDRMAAGFEGALLVDVRGLVVLIYVTTRPLFLFCDMASGES